MSQNLQPTTSNEAPTSDVPKARAVQVRNLSRIFCGVLALVVFLADQATKAMLERSIPEHAVIPIIPGWLNLTHAKNPGAAFSLFADSPAPWKTALLVVVSAALLAVVTWLVLRTSKLHWEAGVGLSLIVGGAASNLLDRIRVGRVVDFIDVFFRTYHWPSFNLADSAIVVGAGFLILHYLFSE
jgi:signal peptidase II